MSREELMKIVAEAAKGKSEYQQGLMIGYMRGAQDGAEQEPKQEAGH